jgi:general secretion pathway protein G
MTGFSNFKNERGFTLVEVVVVIAVVALLAAIMTPLIAKNIDDAKTGRAENEAEVIAAAVGNFYKDVGRWPTMDAAGAYNGVTTLVSGNAAAPGIAINSNGWVSDASGASIDYLDNHLLDNTPKGAATYQATGRNAWHGPYLDTAPVDPWGTPYMINIAATDSTSTSHKALVISAGPNGVMDTAFATTRTALPGGDDIAVSFYVR